MEERENYSFTVRLCVWIVDIFLCCLLNTSITCRPGFSILVFLFSPSMFSECHLFPSLLSASPPHLLPPWPLFLFLSLCPCLINSTLPHLLLFPSLPVFGLPSPLHTIQPCNHIIKQHYCIRNYVWIISRWAALTALLSFVCHPLTSEVSWFYLNEMNDGEAKSILQFCTSWCCFTFMEALDMLLYNISSTEFHYPLIWLLHELALNLSLQSDMRNISLYLQRGTPI